MKIGIDFDDVIVDLVSRWLELYNKDWNDDLTNLEINDWDISRFVKPVCGDKIYDYLDRPELYDNISFIPGAIETIQKLKSENHEIFVITSYDHPSKYIILKNNNIVDDKNHYIVTDEKWLCDIDVLLDDNLSICMKCDKRIKSFVFDRPHNRNKFANKQARVFSWNEFYQKIQELVKMNEEKNIYNYDVSKGGIKNDQGKLLWALLPHEATKEIVKVMTYGATKYEPYNWAKGMPYSRVYSALLRHLTAWWSGEDKDEETGLSHLAHAGCCLLFLLSYEIWNYKNWDDRYKK